MKEFVVNVMVGSNFFGTFDLAGFKYHLKVHKLR